MKRTLLMTLLLGGSLVMTEAQQLAFPGAEGFGKYAVGGRNGSVYHVTNLNDSGAGSLRDAVSQPNRIVVFDVAGVIKLESRLVFKNNLYVAGQTAPGEGITVYGNGVSFSGANNTIVRYLRFRMGVGGDSGKDAAGVSNGTNMIFDHLSVSWGRDETFSISSDGKGDLGNITIQNSIISQGLMDHCAGGLVQADNITLYRNLYADNDTRNAKIKGKNQYVNNIVYNWSSGCFIMGGDSEGTHYANAQGNLFINGPGGGGNAFGGANSDFHIYATDNWQDKDKDGTFDPYEIPQSEFTGGPTFMTSPMEAYELPIAAGNTLMDEVLPTVGASYPYRDYADWYVLNEVKSLGKKGAFISRETALPFGAPTDWNLWAGNKRTDSDGDGMPDEWESANGTDPAKNDAMTIAANGYANIENYINSITVADREVYLRKLLCPALVQQTQNSLTFSWLNYTEGESGVSVELKEGTEFKEVARLDADAETYTLEGLTAETAYTVRMRAFDENGNYSEYSDELTMKTKPIPVEMVDVANYVADYSWAVGAGNWDLTTDNWYDVNEIGGAYENNSKVLFQPSGTAYVTLNETVSPTSVVVSGPDSTIISGTGAIAGTTSVNKTGEGVLVLNTTNSYTGQTVLHGGTIEFNSLANGGVNSAIGASSEFAQNWIWNGGVWKYTGGKASTNRQALAYEQTEFNIANGATITSNGHIEGVGGMTLNGNGQLTVSSTNFFQYEGPTILKGSTLYLSTVDVAKAGIGKSSKLVMAGGELKTKGESSNYETYSFPIEVQEGTTSFFSPNRNCYIKSKVTGSGNIQINIPYLREYIQGDWSGFTGRVIANGVNSNTSEGSLFLLNGNNNDMPNAVVMLKGCAHMAGWSTNCDFELGGVSGDKGTYIRGSSKKDSGFTCKWTVGGANTDETFHGIINNLASSSTREGTVSITKKGSGDWRLTGNNVYKGTTTINGGRLIVNGTHTGTGAVTVNNQGTLAGYGTLPGRVTVKSGGTVSPGDTLVKTAHTLKLNGGLTVEKGGVISLPVEVSSSGTATVCKLVVKGTMVINDATLNLDIVKGQEDLVEGSSLYLFNMANVSSVSGTGIVAIEPAVPGEGLAWDASNLLTTGRLNVVSATSIGQNMTEQVAVWPLAFNGDLHVKAPNRTQVTVYNMVGNAVAASVVSGEETVVDMAACPSGLYIVKVGNDKVYRVMKK
ncbi:MAG: autotransporter-associated beta strand repeat-containing protein [Bacteroidaceae bacterium]|nr:autotransporter-associated beta strand repeat-containing protein [Bacteroidaceae bacterium]